MIAPRLCGCQERDAGPGRNVANIEGSIEPEPIGSGESSPPLLGPVRGGADGLPPLLGPVRGGADGGRSARAPLRAMGQSPPPRFHLTRYAEVVPGRGRAIRREDGPCEAMPRELFSQEKSKEVRASRHPWAWLLKRVFAVEVLVCVHCAGKLRLVEIATQLDGAVFIRSHASPARQKIRTTKNTKYTKTEGEEKEGVFPQSKAKIADPLSCISCLSWLKRFDVAGDARGQLAKRARIQAM